jgi:hypothetical protein
MGTVPIPVVPPGLAPWVYLYPCRTLAVKDKLTKRMPKDEWNQVVHDNQETEIWWVDTEKAGTPPQLFLAKLEENAIKANALAARAAMLAERYEVNIVEAQWEFQKQKLLQMEIN